MCFMLIRKFKMSLKVLAYGMWMFGVVWCSIIWLRGHGLLLNHYILSSIDHVVWYFFSFVFYPWCGDQKVPLYKIRFKAI